MSAALLGLYTVCVFGSTHIILLAHDGLLDESLALQPFLFFFNVTKIKINSIIYVLLYVSMYVHILILCYHC